MSFSNNHQKTWKRYRFVTYRSWKLHSTTWGHMGSGDKVGESGSEELLSAGKQEGTLVSAGTGSTHPLVGRGGQQGGFQGQWEGAPCSHLVREWPRSWIYSLLTRLLCGLPEHEITRLTGKNDMGLQSHSWEISL